MLDLQGRLCDRLIPRAEAVLLVGAGLQNDEAAAACWREWAQRRDLDDVSWDEHKILAYVARRLATIAPECAYRPRVEGLARADWTRSQMVLRGSAPAVQVLVDSGIEVMLLKGGALQAVFPKGSGARLSGDLDVMVRRRDFAAAVRVLHVAGWRSKDSMEYSCVRWRFASGTNLRKPPFGDIDVHHQPIHGPALPDAVLDALWSRSDDAVFHGLPVRVPALADLVAIAAAHGVQARSESEYGFSWLFDLDALLRHPRFDALALSTAARALKVVPATLAALRSLDRMGDNPRTAEGVRALASEPAARGEWFRFWLDALPVAWAKPLQSAVGLLYPAIRAAREREFVPRIRPLLVGGHGVRQIDLHQTCSEFGIRHEIALPQFPGRALIVELACPVEGASRRRFDVAVDGQIVGRISLRVWRCSTGMVKGFRCRIPLEGALAGRISIEALGQFSVLAGATSETLERARPAPFAISAVSVV